MGKSIHNKLTKLQFLSLVLFSILNTFGYSQSISKYPPTGKMIDAGGHLLHIHVMGTGKPVVVFENGSADFSFIWDLVQPEISKIATTVSYDRAGYAWSEQGPVPRTARQIAYELHTALQNAGITGPYIMVGQSYGGFLVRAFARFYKSEVVGLVLVDALNENEKIMMGKEALRVRDMAQGRKEPPIQPYAKVKIDTVMPNEGNPLASNTAIEAPLDRLSQEDQKMQLWAQTQFSYYKAVSGEMDWSPEDVADMYKNKGKSDYLLGNIPLVVISKGKGSYSDLHDSAELEKQRQYLQNDLAHLSTNSKHIIDKNSGHNIHLEDPETVIEAIKLVINSYETKTKLK